MKFLNFIKTDHIVQLLQDQPNDKLDLKQIVKEFFYFKYVESFH